MYESNNVVSGSEISWVGVGPTKAGQFKKSFDGSRDPIYSYILGHPCERISRFGPKLMVHDSFKDLKMH